MCARERERKRERHTKTYIECHWTILITLITYFYVTAMLLCWQHPINSWRISLDRPPWGCCRPPDIPVAWTAYGQPNAGNGPCDLVEEKQWVYRRTRQGYGMTQPHEPSTMGICLSSWQIPFTRKPNSSIVSMPVSVSSAPAGFISANSWGFTLRPQIFRTLLHRIQNLAARRRNTICTNQLWFFSLYIFLSFYLSIYLPI